MTFQPGESAPGPATYVIGLVHDGERVVVADIRGRGWCAPSGRVEPGETPEQAARRELWEEAGAKAGDLRLLGHYVIGSPPAAVYSVVLVGDLLSMQGPPRGSEGTRSALMSLDELRESYFEWTPLFEEVFSRALRR